MLNFFKSILTFIVSQMDEINIKPQFITKLNEYYKINVNCVTFEVAFDVVCVQNEEEG